MTDDKRCKVTRWGLQQMPCEPLESLVWDKASGVCVAGGGGLLGSDGRGCRRLRPRAACGSCRGVISLSLSFLVCEVEKMESSRGLWRGELQIEGGSLFVYCQARC